MITLIYAGLSQGESETLFKMFEVFGVNEIEEDITDEYVSMIHLQIPIEYNADFFKVFGLERWEDLKNLLKNIRWRRGNKNFKLTLYFNGKPDVRFDLLTDSDMVMNKALDTIEYQVDNIILQLDKIVMNVESISYRFDVEIYRWIIDKIMDSNKHIYRYINNRWLGI